MAQFAPGTSLRLALLTHSNKCLACEIKRLRNTIADTTLHAGLRYRACGESFTAQKVGVSSPVSKDFLNLRR